MPSDGTIHHLRLADAGRSILHVFIRDLEIDARIGVHAHEKNGAQKVRLNVDLSVVESAVPLDDSLSNTVCYEDIVNKIKAIVGKGHINLAETLAERIADACLIDDRVIAVCVRVEKINAVPEAAGVGVEIERRRPSQ